MFRLPRIILARKIVALVIDRSQCFDCFVYFFLSFQPRKNADFKNFRGFVRTPRTPPPYGPVCPPDLTIKMNFNISKVA